MSSETNTHVIRDSGREDDSIINQIRRIFCAVSTFTRGNTYEHECTWNVYVTNFLGHSRIFLVFLFVVVCPRFVYGIKKIIIHSSFCFIKILKSNIAIYNALSLH